MVWPDIFLQLECLEDRADLGDQERQALMFVRERLEAAYELVLTEPKATRGPLSKALGMDLDKIRGDERESNYAQLMAQQVYQQSGKSNMSAAARAVLSLLHDAGIPLKNIPEPRTLIYIYKRSPLSKTTSIKFGDDSHTPLEIASTHWAFSGTSPCPQDYIERLKFVERRPRNKSCL